MAESDYVVAKSPIYFDGYLAHNPGDQVPVVNVERHGWADLVAPAAAAAAAAAVEAPVVEPVPTAEAPA